MGKITYGEIAMGGEQANLRRRCNMNKIYVLSEFLLSINL
jgi:hypothetical protein